MEFCGCKVESFQSLKCRFCVSRTARLTGWGDLTAVR